MFLNLILYHEKPISLIRLHKIMFLFLKAAEKSYYDFIPNKYGCYSINLHNDKLVLLKTKMLLETKGDSPFSTFISIDKTQVDICSLLLKKDDALILEDIITSNSDQTDDNMVNKIYKAYPFYGIRSSIIDRFISDTIFIKQLDHIKYKIENAPRGLYTIGYEGLSIDRFIQLLITRNIKTLVDVRINSFSMRPEFRKNYIATALSEAGIAYIQLPEVGIPSSIRKELLPSGKQFELFEWYKKNTLPQCADSAIRIAELVCKGNVALMCYEKDPKDCHRSLFADYCKKMQPSIPVIKHIVGVSNAKKSIHNSPNLSHTFS